jgi:hypothetical protein
MPASSRPAQADDFGRHYAAAILDKVAFRCRFGPAYKGILLAGYRAGARGPGHPASIARRLITAKAAHCRRSLPAALILTT